MNAQWIDQLLPINALVHLIDLRLVLVRNLLSLYLLCGSEHAVLGRPLVRGQDDSAEQLHGLESVLLAQCVDLSLHEVLYFLVGA
jgi:hypothetical protein